MGEQRIIVQLILVMAGVSTVVAGVGSYMLYQAALAEERARLVETAQSQARLIEAVGRFGAVHSDGDHSEDWMAATLTQVIDWHKQYQGFGKTGEFTLARRSGDEIVFLLRHRHFDLDDPRPVPFDSPWAEPMRRALSGRSGAAIALDYRGAKVLAAYEPVAQLNWGIVVKIDLSEVRAPFVRAGIVSGGVTLVVIFAAAVLFVRISRPVVRRLQESEARMRAIFDAAADAIMTIGDGGMIESFNDAAERIFGCAAHEVIGREVRMLMPTLGEGDYHGHSREQGGALDQSSGGLYRETVGQRKDGRWVPIELAISEVRRTGRRALIAIVRDITERKRAAETLATTLADLKRSNEELQQFAHVASHDLQEPLRMVASYTQLLERRYKNQLDEDAREFIHFAVDGAARMQALINALLTYSRVGARPKVLEPVDFEVVLDHVMTDLAVSIRETDAMITHDRLPTVVGDALLLRQLLQNLIANAIKFRSDDVPKIHVSAVRDGNQWSFSVRDNGIGIDPKYKDRILVIFQRLHAKEEYSGTGIGLAVCKKIVERHGGRIWVESEVGKGATFYFTLAARQGEEPLICKKP